MLIDQGCPIAHRPAQNVVQLCVVCKKNLLSGVLPALCYNTCPLREIPAALSRLNSTSVRLIAPELPFTKITALPHFQFEVDSAIYVPASTSNIAHRLPREDNEAEVIQVPDSVIAPPPPDEPRRQHTVHYEQVDRVAVAEALQ